MIEIKIDFEPGQASIIGEALAVAARRLRDQARNLPLRSQDPDTKRYIYFDAAGTLAIASTHALELAGRCSESGERVEIWVDGDVEGSSTLGYEVTVTRTCWGCPAEFTLTSDAQAYATVPEHDYGKAPATRTGDEP
jgi:hypothetical protein